MHHFVQQKKDSNDRVVNTKKYEIVDAHGRSEIRRIENDTANALTPIRSELTRQGNYKVDRIYMNDGKLYAASGSNILSGPISDFTDSEARADIKALERSKVDDGYVEKGVAYFTGDGNVLFSISGISGNGLSAEGVSSGNVPMAKGDDTWEWTDISDKITPVNINDQTVSTNSAWSSSKTQQEIQNLKAVRYDKAQSQTSAQKTQAKSNIGLDQVMSYKGNVSDVSRLPSNAATGDMYTVGGNTSYIYNGSQWTPIGTAESTETDSRLDALESSDEEMDARLRTVEAAIGGEAQIHFNVVDELPANGSVGVIYLKPSGGGTGNTYNEYLWVDDQHGYELIGGTAVDLSGYAKTTDLNNYALKTDTVLNTTLSTPSRQGTKGSFSIGYGSSVTASGDQAVAFGASTQATGAQSVAVGNSTKANGKFMTAVGEFNLEGTEHPTWTAGTPYKVGDIVKRGQYAYRCITANADSTWSSSKWKLSQTDTKEAFVVGNGINDSTRSNAAVINWNGDATFAGDVYAEDSKKLATVEYVDQAVEAGGGGADLSGYATEEYVGQQIDAIDYPTVLGPGSSAGSGMVPVSTADGKWMWMTPENVVGSDGNTAGQVPVTDGDGHWAWTDPENIIGDIDLSNYALKADTVLDTTLSRGRKAGRGIGKASFAFGVDVAASGSNSHAEGNNTLASGQNSHAEGSNTTAGGASSHAEGGMTQATGGDSHAEGFSTEASGNYAHAEGDDTTASGNSSHSEGYTTTASGISSHAEGLHSQASGDYAHAGGSNTIANGHSMTAVGVYNIQGELLSYPLWVAGNAYSVGDIITYDDKIYRCKTSNTSSSFQSNLWDRIYYSTREAFVIGNGTQSQRSNAVTVAWNGDIKAAGNVYANYDFANNTGEQLATVSYVNSQAISSEDVDLSIYATKTELNQKADKSQLTNYATNTALNQKADKSELASYATKTELNQKANASDLANYATKTELNQKADESALANYATNDSVSELKVLVIDCGTISSLPKTINNSKISASHVCIKSELGDFTVQQSDWVVTTSDGSLSIFGTISGSTTLKLYLGRT